jgi:hypothetical protein
VIASSGATVERNASRGPNLRAHVERFIQTLKHECLDKFVIVTKRHLNSINSEFQVHYKRERRMRREEATRRIGLMTLPATP